MNKFKFTIAIVLIGFIITSCSFVDKLKEKLSSKDSEDKKEETSKEETKEVTSTSDLEFYNKYIVVSNKVQEAGDKVYKDYISNIPEPKSISKTTFIIAVSFKLSTDNLERVNKEYNRSLFDGGELSKLNASAEMKSEIEDNFKSLLKVMEEFYNTANKVSLYYSKNEWKDDPSKAEGYDSDMKSAYDKYKTAFDKFSASVKKYKPQRKPIDLESIKNPDERSVALLMNSYENTLDAAEEFYDAFNGTEYKGDLSKAKEKFTEFETQFKKDKDAVLSGEFSEKTKYMKYSYEDYFVKMTNMFIDAGTVFFDKAPSVKDAAEYNRSYDNVVNNYNYMITAYNTNINIVNAFRVY